MEKLKLVFCIQILFCLLSAGCGITKEVVLRRIVGPECTATLSQRDSGAIGRASTLVSIIYNGVPDNDTHGEIVLGLNGQYIVDMKWTGPQDLFLSCSQCSPKNVNLETVRAGDTTITYDKNLDVRAISPEAQ